MSISDTTYSKTIITKYGPLRRPQMREQSLASAHLLHTIGDGMPIMWSLSSQTADDISTDVFMRASVRNGLRLFPLLLL